MNDFVNQRSSRFFVGMNSDSFGVVVANAEQSWFTRNGPKDDRPNPAPDFDLGSFWSGHILCWCFGDQVGVAVVEGDLEPDSGIFDLRTRLDVTVNGLGLGGGTGVGATSHSSTNPSAREFHRLALKELHLANLP